MTSARGGAVALLDAVLGRSRLMSDLTVAGGPLDPLSPADRARAQRLATEVLRGLDRADRLLGKHLTKAPPLTVQNILRLGTWELSHGEAAHGVVNDCVALAGEAPRGASMKGLVNAVLRKIAAEAQNEWPRLRVPRLPEWLRLPLTEAWGPQAVAAMEAAHFAGAPLDLTPRDAAETEALAAELGAEVLPTGSLRLSAPGQVSALPGYDAGRWWVQDAAAALPARMLGIKPGDRVLDLCAAPGGKTLQIAAAGAGVTALDLSEKRMERVAENLARTGLTATTITGDVLEHHGGPYDAILLDAPCSATGTIRRHPDLPHAADGRNISDLIDLQAQMIDHALTLLKPGGRLVYCTCSLIPDEGECQTDEALARHPGLRVDTDARNLPGVPEAWHSSEGGLRIRPDHWGDRGGIDGFYMVALRL
ncbi:16S rRNA methyltransferase [Oceanicola sp. 22II-s10i]|nr:16S rRNA methyltransferase [Oceanicola sp. 22II-s10i]